MADQPPPAPAPPPEPKGGIQLDSKHIASIIVAVIMGIAAGVQELRVHDRDKDLGSAQTQKFSDEKKTQLMDQVSVLQKENGELNGQLKLAHEQLQKLFDKLCPNLPVGVSQ